MRGHFTAELGDSPCGTTLEPSDVIYAHARPHLSDISTMRHSLRTQTVHLSHTLLAETVGCGTYRKQIPSAMKI